MITLFFNKKKIHFIRILGLLFAKFLEYFKNKPVAEILKRILVFVLKICKCNTVICFLLSRINSSIL